MHIRNAQNVTPLRAAHGEVVYELCGTAAGGSVTHSLARIVIPPGKASRRHYHPVAEESYTILEGEALMDLDGEQAPLKPGDAVVIPAGQIHQIRNVGPRDVVLLAVCVPAWVPDDSVYLD